MIYSSTNRPPKRGLDCGTDTPVQQHFRDASDINQVMSRYLKTGVLSTGAPSMGAAQAMYGDFTDIGDYMACQNRIIAAQTGFDRLPSRVRARFRNQPMELVAFFSNPDNHDEAVELGLIEPPVAAKSVISDDPVPNNGSGSVEPKQAPRRVKRNIVDRRLDERFPDGDASGSDSGST